MKLRSFGPLFCGVMMTFGCDDDKGSPADAAVDAAAAEAGADVAAGDVGTGDRAAATDVAAARDVAAAVDAAAARDAAAAGDAAAPDRGGDTPPAQTPVQRGKYLVDVVLGCGDCHTPRLMTGAPDPAKYLAGVSCLFDVAPMSAMAGCVSSKNLTNHETGLKNVTDDRAVRDMIRTGKRPDGKFLHSFMPYFEFANLTDADADAVVAYLRTVPGIDNRPTASQPPFDQPPPAAAPGIDLKDVPEVPAMAANAESARRGRYLAAMSCIGCHTKEVPMAAPDKLPIDATMFFAGTREFPAAAFGLPVPPFPAVIYSQNLTNHATGLMGWTPADVVKVLKMGKDKMDKGVCPPMPAGPMGNFGGLTDADAMDIANYIVTLPGKANMLPNQCTMP